MGFVDYGHVTSSRSWPIHVMSSNSKPLLNICEFYEEYLTRDNIYHLTHPSPIIDLQYLLISTQSEQALHHSYLGGPKLPDLANTLTKVSFLNFNPSNQLQLRRPFLHLRRLPHDQFPPVQPNHTYNNHSHGVPPRPRLLRPPRLLGHSPRAARLRPRLPGSSSSAHSNLGAPRLRSA